MEKMFGNSLGQEMGPLLNAKRRGTYLLHLPFSILQIYQKNIIIKEEEVFMRVLARHCESHTELVWHEYHDCMAINTYE